VAVDIALLPVEQLLGFDIIMILVLPALEETLKLYIARKYQRYTFYGIALFGLMELIFVKFPLLTEVQLAELPLYVAFALLVFIFHLSTAIAYARAGERNQLAAVYVTCLGLHIAFNANDLVVHEVSWQLAINSLLALTPLGAGILVYRAGLKKIQGS
jgi:hypothetical protein